MSEELNACRISPASTAVLPLVGLLAHCLLSRATRVACTLQRRALVSLALPLSRSVVCDFVNEIQMREDIFFLSSWLILIWVYDIFELLTARQTHTHTH